MTKRKQHTPDFKARYASQAAQPFHGLSLEDSIFGTPDSDSSTGISDHRARDSSNSFLIPSPACDSAGEPDAQYAILRGTPAVHNAAYLQYCRAGVRFLDETNRSPRQLPNSSLRHFPKPLDGRGKQEARFSRDVMAIG